MGNDRNFRQRPSAEDLWEKYGGTPPNKKEENMQFIVFDAIFDFSGSMKAFYSTLIMCFNEILLDALLGASRKNCTALRLGCMFFSNTIVKPWDGFLSLDEAKERPLTTNDYNRHGLGGCTALYRAMIESIRRTDKFAKAIKRGNSKPIRKIMILTDGANNLDPLDPFGVLHVIKESRLSEGDIITLAYFKTSDGLSEREFKEMAKQTGVTNTYFADLTIGKGKDIEAQKKDFRHHFGILSSQTA